MSTTLPLFTSLPPAMRRYDKSGSDIGRDYQQRCIASWIDNGFAPVTVNAAAEDIGHVIGDQPVEIHRVTRDASAEIGKPLIFLEDVKTAILERADGPVVFVNADIEISMSERTRQWFTNLSPGKCAFLKRLDVDDPDAETGEVFADGFDLCAFHTEDLRRIDMGPFVIGVPWWDHWLPVAMIMAGLDHVGPEEAGIARHLIHEDRWDPMFWRKYGEVFKELILERGWDRIDSTGYGEGLAAKIPPRPPRRFEWLKSRRRRAEKDRRWEQDNRLTRLATANIALVDAARAAHP